MRNLCQACLSVPAAVPPGIIVRRLSVRAFAAIVVRDRAGRTGRVRRYAVFRESRTLGGQTDDFLDAGFAEFRLLRLGGHPFIDESPRPRHRQGPRAFGNHRFTRFLVCSAGGGRLASRGVVHMMPRRSSDTLNVEVLKVAG